MVFRRDIKDKIARKILENVPSNHFLPTPYQFDLLETAYQRNTIICSSNQFMKNFFVLNLIREMRFDNRGKHVLYLSTVVDECHNVLDQDQPLALLLHSLSNINGLVENTSMFGDMNPRILCFTSSLLPEKIMDPIEARKRLTEIERLTNCQVETASELLTLLSFGAHPQERVLFCNKAPVQGIAFHNFMVGVLQEIKDFIVDMELSIIKIVKCGMEGEFISLDAFITSSNFEVNILDYCKRAVGQCEETLNELGLWCAAEIARVFVKHLIGLYYKHCEIVKQSNNESDANLNNLVVSCADQVQIYLSNLMLFCITQLCMLVRLFQLEFDSILTLEEFHKLVSPKVLQLIDQLKTYKPNVDFRIEVAELSSNNDGYSSKKESRQTNSRRSSFSNISMHSVGSNNSCKGILPTDMGFQSLDSSDTMSSLSDDDTASNLSLNSRSSCGSRKLKMDLFVKKRKSHYHWNKTHSKHKHLHFVPVSKLDSQKLNFDAVDQSDLVYRAVLAPNASNGEMPIKSIINTNRLCGLITVLCQFRAYALSRLIEELCIWDVDLYFVKPGHLFCRQMSSTSPNEKSCQTYSGKMRTMPFKGELNNGTSLVNGKLPDTHKETVANFRRGSINLLVATQSAIAAACEGVDLPKCNLVIALAPPKTLAEYLTSKARSRLVEYGAKMIYLFDETHGDGGCGGESQCGNAYVKSDFLLQQFQQLEQLLVHSCRSYELFSDEHDVNSLVADNIFSPFCPRGQNGPKLFLSKSINIINQYCARLPSDYLTSLTPRWRWRTIPHVFESDTTTDLHLSCGIARELKSGFIYQCYLRLPINCPLKEEISGKPMVCKKLAKLSAAFNAIKQLYNLGELDSRFRVFDRDNHKHDSAVKSCNLFSSDWSDSLGSEDFGMDISAANISRHSQYFYRKSSILLANALPKAKTDMCQEDVIDEACDTGCANYLYFIDQILVNTSDKYAISNGRYCPDVEPVGFGILTSQPLHHIPTFPIFTRSGHEHIRLIELWSPNAPVTDDSDDYLPIKPPVLTKQQLDQLMIFHRILFQDVLRLERGPAIVFNFEKSHAQIVLVPTRRDTCSIDWDFVSFVIHSRSPKIGYRLLPRTKSVSPSQQLNKTKANWLTKEIDKIKVEVGAVEVKSRNSMRTRQLSRKLSSTISTNPSGLFEFRESDFVNAVVTPSYRNLDQPQYYYVTRIKFDLTPLSSFPSQVYGNFASYYINKYDVALTTLKQPLLDVDLTELRLNLIVPRYMNSQGQSLSNVRGRDRGTNFMHKQLLIPELCLRHTFPASIWHKAICLPSILYRLEHLLIAEELRLVIARETRLGCSTLPTPNRMKKLDFVNQIERQDDRDVFDALQFSFPVDHQSTVLKKADGDGKLLQLDADEKNSSIDENGSDSDESTDLEYKEYDKNKKKVVLHVSSTSKSSGLLKLDSSKSCSGLSESMLEESKVVDVNQLDLQKWDIQDELNLEQTSVNSIDSSDTESVDSFEGQVHFFPPEDDDLCKQAGEYAESSTSHYCPGPATILQAITMSCSNDFINLERLETIGDSFLKFAVTVHLYLTHQFAHEGRLSYLRSQIVCNSNLYRLGRAKQLQDRMVNTKFEPNENWIPPGYCVSHGRRSNSKKQSTTTADSFNEVIWSTDKLMDDEVLRGMQSGVEDAKIQQATNFTIGEWDPDDADIVKAQHIYDHSLLTLQQAIPAKSIADCVEAIVGCYLTCRGERSALRLMRWFGIDCLPSDKYMKAKGAPWNLVRTDTDEDFQLLRRFEEARVAWGFDELECLLHYKFRDPRLLVQAFTHPSYRQLRGIHSPESMLLTDSYCYQRLEFLGDAVLDYVITRFLYEDSKRHSPGILTDLRSALVNNNIFAALAVRIGLHRFCRSSSPQLLYAIDAFVHYQKDVVNDDLDYITEESVDVRYCNQSSPPFDDQVETLCNSTARVQSSIDDLEESANDESENLLANTKQSESAWQSRETQKLTSDFVSGNTITAANNNSKISTHPLNCNTDDVEIPKALGDVFESLAGAIFIDSNCNLDTIWSVFYPLMKERIERYTSCIPKSPVRQLLELEPESTKFERPQRTLNGQISVCAHILGKGRFYGVGRNYRLAKSLAAKRALKVLRKTKQAAPI